MNKAGAGLIPVLWKGREKQVPRVVLTDEQLIGKANRLIDKLHRQCILNNAEANLLRICITKWGYAKREKETTEV